LNDQEVNTFTETLQHNSLTIFDEYKSNTNYVFHTDNNGYYNIILDSVLSEHEESLVPDGEI
jgi:hypothetical protein